MAPFYRAPHNLTLKKKKVSGTFSWHLRKSSNRLLSTVLGLSLLASCHFEEDYKVSSAAQKLSDVKEQWSPARLIPSVGMRGQDEREKRATSSLLAVIGAVPVFGKALLSDLDAPRGRISTRFGVRSSAVQNN